MRVPVIAWWITATLAAEPLVHAGGTERALTVLTRDAGVAATEVRPQPLYLGGEVAILGDLDGRRCEAPASGAALADALANAERFATLDVGPQALAAVRDAQRAAACLDVPLREGELARLHDLASAIVWRFTDDLALARDHAQQARAVDVDHRFVYQVAPEVLELPTPGETATLRLPPGAWTWRVLVDGAPAPGPAVRLRAGRHHVQVLGAPVVTLTVDVPQRETEAALVLPDQDLTALDPADPATRAWLRVALSRWGPTPAASWWVVGDRLWRAEQAGRVWYRYDARPPRALRPVGIALSAAGVVAGGVMAGVGFDRWGRLDACGTTEGASVCDGLVDTTTGLIVDASGWSAARRDASALGISGVVVGSVSAVLLGVVAARSGTPRRVRLDGGATTDGVQFGVEGTW